MSGEAKTFSWGHATEHVKEFMPMARVLIIDDDPSVLKSLKLVGKLKLVVSSFKPK